MKKVLILIWLVLFLPLSSCNKKNQHVLFLGNQICDLDFASFYESSTNKEVDASFLMQKGYISYLYSMIEQNATEISTEAKIIDKIKSSSLLILFIGNYDFMRVITSNGEIDEQILKTQSELFSYYYFLLLEEIRLNYNNDIIVLSPFIEYKDETSASLYDKALKEFYLVSEEVSSYFACHFIDTRDLTFFLERDHALNQDACNYLYKKIKNGYK